MSLSKLRDWSKTWLLSLNAQKCKVVSYGRHADTNYKYKMIQQDQIIELDHEDHIKDLGVIFDGNLDFGMHIAERINKAYSMLWLIKRNFKDIGREAFLLLYKHLVRSHLEYCNSVWAVYKKAYIDKLEKVQKRATKMIPKLRKMHYLDRLKQLNLPTLTYRRSRGDRNVQALNRNI